MTPVLHSKILGQGMPLVILHGLLGMGDNWISLGRKYAENGFQVHLVDQRNHGKSFHSDEMTYEEMVQDLANYFKVHKFTKAHILGHSMGGKTAMNFALSYPGLVDKLIVVDIAPKYYAPHHHFIFEAIKHLDLSKYTSRKEVEKALLRYINNPDISQFILKNLGRDQSGRFFWKANIPVLEEALDDLGEALPPQAIIKNDTLFIKGEQSPYITDRDLPLIQAHFPHSKNFIISKAGHWVHAEQPVQFYESSLKFLKNS